METGQRGQAAFPPPPSSYYDDGDARDSDTERSAEITGVMPPPYGPAPPSSSSFENISCNVDDDNDDDSVDSFVESPGEHAEGGSGWCKCPEHDDLLENRLDVDLLSPNGCRAVTDNAPRTRRSFALWAAGAVLFVASVTGGFFFGDVGGRNGRGGLLGSGLGSSGGSTSERHGPVLVYSSDEDQQAGVVASIRSVLMHASGPVEFLYIGDKPLPGMDDMPQVRYRKLSQVVKRYQLEEFTNPTYARSGKNENLNTEPANYVRFVVHELLPKQSKAMWIDADTIVQCDVVQLFKNTFNEKSEEAESEDILTLPAVAAVPRTGYPIGLSGRGRRIYGDEEISFNAGIYLMELDRWRAQKLTDKIREITLANRYQNWYYTGSQPPLALAVKTNFEHLPKSWNVKMKYVKVDESGALRDEVCLMHWAGPNKPWNKGHEDQIHSEFWAVYGTPAADEAMEAASGDNTNEHTIIKDSETSDDNQKEDGEAMETIDEAPQKPALSARR